MNRVALAIGLCALAGCRATVSMPVETDDFGAPADFAHGPIDLFEADLARPPATDMAGGDMATGGGDLAMPDLAMPDLAMPDMAYPVDLAGADLACAMTCNAPPPAMCQANVIVSFTNNGSCV